MSTRERRDRSDKADRDLSELFLAAVAKHQIPINSVVLAAVGGYGRGELSPGSDLDITIIHKAKNQKLDEFVSDFLYPLWSSGVQIDHSVRTPEELIEVAKTDIRVILGALDLRFIAGNEELSSEASEKIVKLWQTDYKKFLSDLHKSINERRDRKSTRLNSSH